VKRIIEVKRGDAAPSSARYLSSKEVPTGATLTRPLLEGGILHYPEMTTVDVFEWEDGLDEKGYPLPRIIRRGNDL
jgi:hypothetical protein